MALRRTSIVMQNQILELQQQGHSIRKIASALNISRNTVRSILRSELPFKEDSPQPQILGTASAEPTINWQKIADSFNKGVPLKVLHQEQAPDITYMIFWHTFRRKFPKKPEVTIRLNHIPGEKIFFDFSDGLFITDPTTGNKTKTQLFAGVLPFSSLTCGEFVMDQKQPTFLRAIENSFQQIGGVPKYVVIDNLKSAVNRAHIYDPDTNQTFIEFANHWGFAVLPARPRRPKDKASVEGGIGIIQKQFFQQVRDQIFYSLFELNQKFHAFLQQLNSAHMKDHGGISRMDRFQNEKHLLQPIKNQNFELSTWKTCKVHPDCHIQIDHRFYSVPHQFVGATVKARVKSNTIEVFSLDAEPLSVHPKMKGSDRASTIDSHYPPEQVATARFEVKQALQQAQRIGPKTHQLFEDFFNDQFPLKFLRRAQGILRLVQKNEVRPEDLEYAAGQAMMFNKKHFYYIKSVAIFHKNGGAKIRVAPPQRDPKFSFLHHHQQSEDL